MRTLAKVIFALLLALASAAAWAVATITIPAHYWAGATQIELRLVDANGARYPAALTDASGFIAGTKVITADADGVTFSLPYNDEIPAPPGQSGTSSYWEIIIKDGRRSTTYRVAIDSSSPITTWNELIGASDAVEADSIFVARLLPTGATDGQVAQKNGVTGDWDPVTLSGSAADIDQYDLAGRIIAGSGPYAGIAAADLTEKETPAAGDFVPCWESGTTLRKCDIGDFAAGGSSIVLDLADDDSDESTGVTEIATSGDTNAIFTEPSADKLLIDAGQDWPKADQAAALATDPTDCSANQFANAIVASGNLSCVALGDADIPDDITISGGTVTGSAITLDTGTDPTADGKIQWDSTSERIEIGDDGAGTLEFYPGAHATECVASACDLDASTTAGGAAIQTGTDDDVPESGDFGAAADLEATGALSDDVVAAAEMADADHGDVSWSGGVATVDSGAVGAGELADDLLCDPGENIQRNGTDDGWICDPDATGASDHGALTGLTDDDHSQYALLGGRDGESLAIDEIKAYDGAGLKLYDDGGNGLFVEDGGNVGIGTASPASLLAVAGSARAESLYISDNSATALKIGAGGTWGFRFDNAAALQIKGGNSGGNDNSFVIGYYGNTFNIDMKASDMQFFSTSVSPVMYFEEDTGNVGVGASSPQNLLDINGAAVIGSSYAGVETAPTDGLLVEGNVGIRTADPNAALEVDGLIIPDKVTADPCSSGSPEGGLFYNDTSNYMCYCDGTNDVQMHDPSTACF